MSRRVGVFGGSFDPPHIGHFLNAAYALGLGELDELWVIPTWQHALDKPLGDFDHRLCMCELAFAPLAAASVSDIERQLGGTSYTLELLEELARRHPDAALRLLVGSDILAQRERWHRFDDVARLAPPLVVARAGHPHAELAAGSIEIPEVSSTDVRERLARGHAVEGLLPRAVGEYARQHGLYEQS